MAPIVENYPLKWARINGTVLGDSTIVATVPGKFIFVPAVWLRTAVALPLKFKSAGNVKIDALAFGINETLDVNRLPYGWWVETNRGEALVMEQSLAGNVFGALLYVEVP